MNSRERPLDLWFETLAFFVFWSWFGFIVLLHPLLMYFLGEPRTACRVLALHINQQSLASTDFATLCFVAIHLNPFNNHIIQNLQVYFMPILMDYLGGILHPGFLYFINGLLHSFVILAGIFGTASQEFEMYRVVSLNHHHNVILFFLFYVTSCSFLKWLGGFICHPSQNYHKVLIFHCLLFHPKKRMRFVQNSLKQFPLLVFHVRLSVFM